MSLLQSKNRYQLKISYKQAVVERNDAVIISVMNLGEELGSSKSFVRKLFRLKIPFLISDLLFMIQFWPILML